MPPARTTDERSRADTEPQNAAPRRVGSWWPSLAPAVPLLVLAWVTATQATRRTATSGDQALEELGTASAIHLHQLLGPYSRFVWNHPGPVLFYWSAPFYAIAHHQAGGLALGAVLWNLAALALLTVALRRSLGHHPALWVAATVLLSFVLLLDVERLRDPWNPLLVITPVVATGVAGAAVVAGRRWLLPAAAVAATAAVQTHVGTAPVITAFAFVGVLLAWRGEPRGEGGWRGPIGTTALVLGVLWALPLYQQLTSGRGNLAALVHYFRHSHPRGDLWSVVHVAVSALTLSTTHLGSRLTGPASEFAHLGAARVLLSVAVVSLVVVGARRAPGPSGDEATERRRRFVRALCLTALAGAAASLVAAASATAPANPYLFTWMAGVGLVVWLAAGLAAFELVTDRRDGETRSLSWRPAHRWLGGTVVLALTVAVALTARQAAGVAPYADIVRSPTAPRLAEAVAEQLPPGGHSVALFVGVDGSAWTQAAGAAAVLARRGIAVHVPRQWEFMFGADRHLTGREAVGLLLAVPRDAAIPPGAGPVATIIDPRLGPLGLYVVPLRGRGAG